MKIKYCFLPLLCLFFRVAAQEKKPSVTGADSLKSGLKNEITTTLKIGDRVPDVLISGISGLTINGIPHKVAYLSDFRGKLLILDFWATWCAPCRAMVPVMDSLQKQFAGQMLFLPVTYESRAVVDPVIAQMQKLHPFTLPEVTGDTRLHALFPHRSLPHYVWIDGNGILCAVTEYQQVTAGNILNVLSKNTAGTAMAEKHDVRIAYDQKKPLFIGGNGGEGAGLIYHSLLSGYQEGIGGGVDITALDSITGQRFTARNSGFLWLGRLAYADSGRWFPNARIRLETRDSLKMTSRLTGEAYARWLKAGNGWNYELQVPPRMAPDAFRMIREDLGRLFPAYRIGVETRKIRSLVLVRTSRADKIKTGGGRYTVDIGPYACHIHNVALKTLMLRLELQYMQNSPLPIADGTGYRGMVDLDFEAPLNNLAEVNRALAKYDLAFIEKEYPAQLLVFRDSPAFTHLNP